MAITVNRGMILEELHSWGAGSLFPAWCGDFSYQCHGRDGYYPGVNNACVACICLIIPQRMRV